MDLSELCIKIVIPYLTFFMRRAETNKMLGYALKILVPLIKIKFYFSKVIHTLLK